MCYKKIECHGKSEKGAILKLNAYIKQYERKFGKISSSKVLSQKQLRLLNLIHKLVEAIDKEDTNKQQGINSSFSQSLFINFLTLFVVL